MKYFHAKSLKSIITELARHQTKPVQSVDLVRYFACLEQNQKAVKTYCEIRDIEALLQQERAKHKRK